MDAKPSLSALPAHIVDRWRPAYHFTPPANWLNDPNGLVHYEGEYHLFYQHYPKDSVWGPMHWGHAVSRDLFKWEHLPIALYPDDHGFIFSGSAVIDWHNTSGFGKEAMVAIFTHHDEPRQSQSLAYSTDRGRTWTKYAGNPVIEPPAGMRNFRDPKVFWYGDPTNGHWVMVLAAGQTALFYTSPNLIDWAPSGDFGLTHGAQCGVWETPDLFELPVDGGPETRWVLTVGIGACAPAGGSGTQYFVGSFDGREFTSENPAETILWADYGADFYAPQSFSDVPDGRRLWLGWMSNWAYALQTPPTAWRGAMTAVRELALRATVEGIRLVQAPLALPEGMVGRRQLWQSIVLEAGEVRSLPIGGGALEIKATFDVTGDAEQFGIEVHAGSGQQTVIGYDARRSALYVDRGASGVTDFSDAFTASHVAPLAPQDGVIELHVLVDRSSVEVFANGGERVMTERVFPDAAHDGVALFAAGGGVTVRDIAIALVR